MQIVCCKRWWLFCILIVVLSATAALAAQEYPAKPIRLIVPFVPGGGTDMIARTIGQGLTEFLRQNVVIDNRAGAGGMTGADIVAKAAPDGYTLLMGTPGPLTINPNLRAKIPYDTMRDFIPISLATISPFILVVNPSVPAKTVKELIALAKAKPNVLNYGSAGDGSVAHLASEQFKALAGIQIMHVPYKGAGQSLIDLLSGQVQLIIENLPVVLSHIQSGKLRALAVGTKMRSELVPEFPTMREAGVPGYEQSTASGILAPAKTPANIIAKLNREIVKVLQKSEAKERLAAQGVQAVGSSPEQYAEHLRDELAQYAKVVKAAGIKLE
jgi:tripartite-type tricarboxylate transporter receptor subunit TctC